MYDYREYCPVAKAAQLLCERWTLLIVRELLSGSTRFNQMRRLLPRISPTLLKARLRLLEDEGIVVRVKRAEGDGFEYELTASGQALGPVVMALGEWSTSWQYEKFKDEPIHTEAMMRDLELTLLPAQMPGVRTVLKFLFDEEPQAESWYVVVDGEHVEACDEDRAFDVDVYLSGTPRVVCDILLGKLDLKACMNDRRLKVTGSKPHIDRIGQWFGLAPYVNKNEVA